MTDDVRAAETDVQTGSTEAVPSGSANRVRSRLARFGSRGAATSPALEPLLLAIHSNHPKADLSVVEQAYVVAERAHRGQLRKSGDPTSRIRWPWPRSSPSWG